MDAATLGAYIRFAFDAVALNVGRQKRAYALGAILVGALALAYVAFFLPPRDFPRGIIVTVEGSVPAHETVAMLAQHNVVSSDLILKGLLRLTGGDRSIRAGRYMFTEPVGTFTVFYRITNGISGIPVTRVTFPEGTTAREMGSVLATAIPGFDAARFAQIARPYEGYLFPDTYDFYADSTPEEVVERLRATFDAKTAAVRLQAQEEGKDFEDIVIMASLIEKEAAREEDRKEISGILWSRLEGDMALQVDAVFGYIQDRATYHPSLEDLEIESPYNTYRNRGLPPGAIANPGLSSLEAALFPNETDYVYYLTGRDGRMYYARTFEEHKENRARYLD